MGTIFSTVLVVAPVAFLVGWLLAKALFRQMNVVRPGATRRAESVPAAVPTADPAQQQPANGATAELRRALQEKVAAADALRAELKSLREGVAESDQTIAELRRRLAEKTQPPEVTPADAAAGVPAGQDKDVQRLLKVQQSRVAQRDKKVAELERELATAEARITQAKQRFAGWRRRIRPLAQQFRQQRTVISELRAQLRDQLRQQEERRQRREARRAQAAESAAPATPTPQPAAAQVPQRAEPASAGSPVANSDLQSLKGVGPALHRRLNEQGIYNLSQVAEMDETAVRALARALSLGELRVVNYDWVGQARAHLGLEPRRAAEQADAALAAV